MLLVHSGQMLFKNVNPSILKLKKTLKLAFMQMTGWVIKEGFGGGQQT
jgi:hypothetical protein